jgi:hypothetical protein
VLVMDCTLTGAPPPTARSPSMMRLVGFLSIRSPYRYLAVKALSH